MVTCQLWVRAENGTDWKRCRKSAVCSVRAVCDSTANQPITEWSYYHQPSASTHYKDSKLLFHYLCLGHLVELNQGTLYCPYCANDKVIEVPLRAITLRMLETAHG